MSSRSDDKKVYEGHIYRDDAEITLTKLVGDDAKKAIEDANQGDGKTNVFCWIKGQEDMPEDVRADHVHAATSAIAALYKSQPGRDDSLLIIKNNDETDELTVLSIGDSLRMVIGLTEALMRVEPFQDAVLCALEMFKLINGSGATKGKQPDMPDGNELIGIQECIDKLDYMKLHDIVNGYLDRQAGKRKNMMS